MFRAMDGVLLGETASVTSKGGRVERKQGLFKHKQARLKRLL